MVAETDAKPAVSLRLPESFGRPKSTLLAIFEQKRRNALIWFLVAVAAWLWAAWDHQRTVAAFAAKREVVVIDSLGTYYVSPLLDIEHAKELHAWQTKLACKALFERNPDGLDNPELFKLLFLPGAAEVAQAAINHTKPEFQAKSLHQKVELGEPEVLSTRNNAFYTSVVVQLIRVGIYQGQPITEVLRYRANFKFVLNPDLTRNGRFPTAVAAFQVEPLPKA